MESSKLRLMCSNGGHILPRPHDKSLCYVGGETRLILIHRHTTLQNLTHHLNTKLFQSSSSPSFTIKYQLPFDDLDSLISLTTDEDLENMIGEYDKLNPSSRLRLFIFPTNPPPDLSFGSLLENSEHWFLNALNGSSSSSSNNNNSSGLFSDTSSCLLDLDDHISLPEKKDVGRQDVHSVLDSLMMETSSSFGSATSTNLSPKEVDGPKNVEKLHVSGSHVIIQEKQFTGFDYMLTDQLSAYSQIQSSNSNNQLTDSKETVPAEQKPTVHIHNHNHNSAYLSSTQSDSPRQQITPPLQYIHHHNPSIAAPVTSYNIMYYIPANQPPQGYSFMFQQPRPSRGDTLSVAAGKLSSGGHQVVRVSSGYQKIQNQVPHVGYYATQAMTPLTASGHDATRL